MEKCRRSVVVGITRAVPEPYWYKFSIDLKNGEKIMAYINYGYLTRGETAAIWRTTSSRVCSIDKGECSLRSNRE
jgi:hypothetical protein